jgi:hypothetical protein
MPVDWTDPQTIVMFRESWNYTQMDLARLLAKPLDAEVASIQSMLSTIENGKRSVPRSWVPLLRVLLEPCMSYDKLVGGAMLKPRTGVLPPCPPDGYERPSDSSQDAPESTQSDSATNGSGDAQPAPPRAIPAQEMQVMGPPDNEWLALMAGRPPKRKKQSKSGLMSVDDGPEQEQDGPEQ